MSWIKTIAYEEASGKLKKLYDRVSGPDNHIDNVLSIHSLRPHSLEGHMVMYKNVLHHASNTCPKWYLELVGTYISHLNDCEYCFKHHSVGLKHNLKDDTKFNNLLKAISSDNFEEILSEKERLGLQYARNITLSHTTINEVDIEKLRSVNWSDGEILEINQVACYFNYVNRMVISLGVKLETDNIGLSPNSSDSDDWNHS